jgi:hypothetical protein
MKKMDNDFIADIKAGADLVEKSVGTRPKYLRISRQLFDTLSTETRVFLESDCGITIDIA